MAEDALDAIAPEPVVEPVAAPEPALEPATEASPAPTPEPPVEKPDHSVPLAKYLDTRDELKELKRWKAEQEARAEAPKVPDPIDDPQGHHAYLQREMGQALTAQKFEMSKVMAEQQHGADVVEAALTWAQDRASKDPTFVQEYMASAHPIDVVVRQHKRDSLVSQLPTDIASLDELIERKIAERGLSAPPAAQAALVQPLATPAPPRSIASDTSNASVAAPSDPRSEFLSIFDKG